MFGSKFGFRHPFMMEKYPVLMVTKFLSLKCGLGIGYGIGRKYRPFWFSALVLDLNQNSGYGPYTSHNKTFFLSLLNHKALF